MIGDDGAQLGVMDVARALQLARDAEVDLVEVAPNSGIFAPGWDVDAAFRPTPSS